MSLGSVWPQRYISVEANLHFTEMNSLICLRYYWKCTLVLQVRYGLDL